MKLKTAKLKNFRRLEDVRIDFDQKETVFVGPNNSGKTSATTAFRLFLEKQEFRIHDFSVARISELNAINSEEGMPESLPSIDLELWFSIDPDTEYYRVATLLPNSLSDLDEVGIKLSYQLKDPFKLRDEYLLAVKENKEGEPLKSVCQYLEVSGLGKYFKLRYYALEEDGDECEKNSIDPKQAKLTLSSLIRIDFVDAQRNIHDQEVGRSNRLSQAFAAFYEKNLDQAKVSNEANSVINENNSRLDKHYKNTFGDLMKVILKLGVPSVNDREMRIVSKLSPEAALKGNTELLYVDSGLEHELPEAYNGLGFKNLVYIAIQVSHFHLQWMRTNERRPLCQVIFIEEPEVHLHAQVQQTFIKNIGEIVKQASKKAGEESMIPQLCITTHSSHILDAIEFDKTRYFKRGDVNPDVSTGSKILNKSVVLSLNDFVPEKESASGEKEDAKETKDFLLKYLKLTHCDLFFADAAILVEGTAEKLLLRKMIEKDAPKLGSNYLTVLEVGGAYAHRFASLFEFLGVPYLVITDIDSVDSFDKRKTCRADKAGCVTSNAAIKFFLKETCVAELAKFDAGKVTLADKCFIAFQHPSEVQRGSSTIAMHGRTFEESLIYDNFDLFDSGGDLQLGVEFSSPQDLNEDYTAVFEYVSKKLKKTEFALNLVSSEIEWRTPSYIRDGIRWLEGKLNRTVAESAPTNPTEDEQS